MNESEKETRCKEISRRMDSLGDGFSRCQIESNGKHILLRRSNHFVNQNFYSEKIHCFFQSARWSICSILITSSSKSKSNYRTTFFPCQPIHHRSLFHQFCLSFNSISHHVPLSNTIVNYPAKLSNSFDISQSTLSFDFDVSGTTFRVTQMIFICEKVTVVLMYLIPLNLCCSCGAVIVKASCSLEAIP